MKWFALLSALLALASCAAQDDIRVADSPLAQLSTEEPLEAGDRDFAYLSDELSDHVAGCKRGWASVFSAVGRSAARDWERIEKTFR